MIDVRRENLLTFSQAAAFLPGGRRPSTSTWWRWTNRGIGGVRLETVRVGGRVYTTGDAMARFVAVLSSRSDGRGDGLRSLSKGKIDHERALKQLEREGF